MDQLPEVQGRALATDTVIVKDPSGSITAGWIAAPGRPTWPFAVYLAGYFSGRFWIEGLRIDPAHMLDGLRLDQWVAAIVVVASVEFLVIDWRSRQDAVAIVMT